MADLERRTGLRIEGVDVDEINFLNDTARVTIRARANESADRTLTHTSWDRYES